MPKRHVGLFFHVQTSNPADFNLLITDFAVQVVIFFNYIGGTFSGVPRIFERGGAYDHNQIRLVEKYIQVAVKKVFSLNQT